MTAPTFKDHFSRQSADYSRYRPGYPAELIAWVAVFWVIVLMILFSFPTSGNISITFMIAVVILLAIYYFASAKKNFKGPHAMGTAADLTEIEREFEIAAEEIAQ